MDSLSLAELLQAAASAAAAGRLIQLGFSARQPALLSYLIFVSVDLTALAAVPPASRMYFNIFLTGTALSWIAEVFAVREMFSLTFERYAGIRTAGRWTLYGATALAIVASILLTVFFGHPPGHGNIWLYYAEIVDRSIVLTLALVIAGIVLFLSRFPLHLNRNTYVSTGFFSAVFLSEAAGLVLDNLDKFLFSAVVDITQVTFAALCLVGWAFCLRAEPVAAKAHRVVFENPAESELLQQLDSLNRLLSRVGRR